MAGMYELQHAGESRCSSGNSKIKSHYFPRVSNLHSLQVPGSVESRRFSQAAWAARVHKHAHVQSPSAPPSNHPPTHTNSQMCKHRYKMPINPHRNWHWRTLKEVRVAVWGLIPALANEMPRRREGDNHDSGLVKPLGTNLRPHYRDWEG